MTDQHTAPAPVADTRVERFANLIHDALGARSREDDDGWPECYDLAQTIIDRLDRGAL